jgi:hypothetical protein
MPIEEMVGKIFEFSIEYEAPTLALRRSNDKHSILKWYAVIFLHYIFGSSLNLITTKVIE